MRALLILILVILAISAIGSATSGSSGPPDSTSYYNEIQPDPGDYQYCPDPIETNSFMVVCP